MHVEWYDFCYIIVTVSMTVVDYLALIWPRTSTISTNYTPPHNEVVGGYTGFTPSVLLSVHTSRIPCPLCSAYSFGSIHFIFIHLIKQLQKVCHVMLFIRPFEKRDVLCRGNVRPSVGPSVRPSVRVFRTFLQHALRYQFETWYMHSVGGTTCRVWVASQLGQFDLVYSQK